MTAESSEAIRPVWIAVWPALHPPRNSERAATVVVAVTVARCCNFRRFDVEVVDVCAVKSPTMGDSLVVSEPLGYRSVWCDVVCHSDSWWNRRAVSRY